MEAVFMFSVAVMLSMSLVLSALDGVAKYGSVKAWLAHSC